MRLKEFTDAELVQALEQTKCPDRGHWRFRKACKLLVSPSTGKAVHFDTLRRATLQRNLSQETVDLPSEAKTLDHTYEDGTRETILVGCQSLEELVERFDIDTDEWQVKDGTLQTRSYATPVGEGQIAEIHYMAARWERRPPDDPRVVLRSVEDQIAALSSAGRRAPKRASRSNEACMALVGITDLHLGKPGWVEEAEDAFNLALVESLDEMASRKVGEIVIPVGSDMGHFDTKDGRTSMFYGEGGTALGTSGIGLVELTERCRVLMVDAVEQLRKIAPVRLVCSPGNHDWSLSLGLTGFLEAWYRNDPSVTVAPINDHGRSYLLWGRSLLCIYHGKTPKPQRMAAIVAAEAPKLWGESLYREIIHGHKHHERLHEELAGVMIRGLGCLSPTDEWHSYEGWVGARRAAQTVFYSKQGGVDGVKYHPYRLAAA